MFTDGQTMFKQVSMLLYIAICIAFVEGTTPTPVTTTTEDPFAALDAIGGFDFTTRSKSAAAEKTCKSTDHAEHICVTMGGICNGENGVCIPKQCITDFSCNCTVGFKGNLCEYNITALELAKAAKKVASNGNGKLKGPTSNGKQHVNGHLSTNQVASNKDSYGHTVKSTGHGHDNGIGMYTTTDSIITKSQENGVGGNNDNTGNKTASGVDNGQSNLITDSGSAKNTHNNNVDQITAKTTVNSGGDGSAKRTTQTTGEIKKAAGSKAKINKQITTENAQGIKSKKTKENTASETTPAKSVDKTVREKTIKTNNDNGKSNVTVTQSQSDTASTPTDKQSDKSPKPIEGVGTTTQEQNMKPENGSYRKGPESYVFSNNSPIRIENKTLTIRLESPSLIKELKEVINIETVSVNTIQVELVPPGVKLASNEPVQGSRDVKVNLKTSSVVENGVNKTPKSVNKPALKTSKSNEKSETTTQTNQLLVNSKTVSEKQKVSQTVGDKILTTSQTISEGMGSANIFNHAVDNKRLSVKSKLKPNSSKTNGKNQRRH